MEPPMSPVPRMVTRSKLGRQLRVNAIEAHEEAGHLLRHSHAHPQVLGKAVTPTGRTITPSRRSAS